MKSNMFTLTYETIINTLDNNEYDNDDDDDYSVSHQRVSVTGKP